MPPLFVPVAMLVEMALHVQVAEQQPQVLVSISPVALAGLPAGAGKRERQRG